MLSETEFNTYPAENVKTYWFYQFDPALTKVDEEEFFNKFRTNPNSPGINYEKIDEGIDKNICSVRIDDAYRAIVVRCPDTNVFMLLWVDHHDEAYAWA